MKRILIAGLVTLPVVLSAQQAAPVKATAVTPAKAAPALLPSFFAGWEADVVTPLKAASDADAAHSTVLAEFGYTDGAAAKFTRDGAVMTVHALRFHDATGAYGAYSFYRLPSWAKESIGAGAASDHKRVVFWQGNVMIDATVPEVGVMTASELRELASALPKVGGSLAVAPPLLGYLPQKDLEVGSTRYAVGPVAYAGEDGVLPAALVGFERGAEVATASYSQRSGPAVLTLIDYPTPQMAEASEKAIGDLLKKGVTSAWPKRLAASNTAALGVRRSGPLVAVVSGDSIPDEEKRLLESVHYDASMVDVPVPVDSEGQKLGKLVSGSVMLAAILGGTALFFGLLFGGGRVFYRRLRGKPDSTLNEVQFIRLHLEDESDQAETDEAEKK